MACVINNCNECSHAWAGLKKTCPKCESKDILTEWDEEGDHPPEGLTRKQEKEWWLE